MLNLDHLLVDLGSSDVMMVPVSMTIIAVMKLQIAVMVVMKATVMVHLLPMVCEQHFLLLAEGYETVCQGTWHLTARVFQFKLDGRQED
jgi:hypothetical protein